jgi:hypothetical protein
MKKIKTTRYSKYRELWLEESEDESVLIKLIYREDNTPSRE